MFLSIIIPVYNIPELFLRECIESCLDQDINEDDYEIICIDDGSTNDCLTVLQEYANKYLNVKVVSQENKGLSGARNSGMETAQGDYIWFVDGDDFIARNSLCKLRKVAYEKDVDKLDFGGYHFVNTLTSDEINRLNSGELIPNYRMKTAFVTRSLYRNCFLREFGIRFRSEVKTGEDLIFNFEFAQHDHSVAEFGDVFHFYRIRENSLSHDINQINYARNFIESHIIGSRIVKSYYDKEINKRIKTIRYLHGDLSQIMINISRLEYFEAKPWLLRLVDENLFPFKKWNSKKLLLTIYTNCYSGYLISICKLSSISIMFGIIKCWGTICTLGFYKKLKKRIKDVLYK